MSLQLVIAFIERLGYTPAQFIVDLLTVHDGRCLGPHLPQILDCVLQYDSALAIQWSLRTAMGIYRQELLNTTAKSAGFHSNATNMQPGDVQEFNIASLASRLCDTAPSLWELLLHLLLPDDLRRVDAARHGVQRAVDRGGDIAGEDGPVLPQSVALPDDPMDVDGSNPRESLSVDNNASAGGMVAVADATEIKAVTIFGIMQQCANQRCNMVQANMGLFLRLTHTPDVVVSVLNHIGAATSSSTIDSSCDSLDQVCERLLGEEGKTLTTQEAYDNFNFKQKVAIPVPGRGDIFISATSAIAIRSHPCLSKENFRYDEKVWLQHPGNRLPRRPGQPSVFKPTYMQVLKLPALLDPRRKQNLPPAAPDTPSHTLAMHAWHIRRILLAQSPAFKNHPVVLDEPPQVVQIPLNKTEYLPMRAMELNQSTTQGNIQALEAMYHQIKFPADAANEYFTLVHADLGGCERIHAAQADRCDEDRAVDQFRNIVDCPGLFHMKMATTDAIYRLYLSKPGARHDGSSLWSYIKKLRPRQADQARFSAKSGPGYRRMHDISRHVTWALVLECWEREVERWSGGFCTTLPDFAALLQNHYTRQQASHIIDMLSLLIARTYVAGTSFSTSTRNKPQAKRDLLFENWQLWLSYSLMDEELDISIKQMDVGRVCLVLWYWMFIFQGTGKHKYAHHTLRVLCNIAYVFPKPLAHAFLMSWIINPSGKPGHGRGVDWLVELFNLYLKVVHSGSSSNAGMKRITKVSTLISLFKYVFENFVLNYRILSRTVRHAPPDMSEAIESLRRNIRADRALVFTPGRRVVYAIPDALATGFDAFQRGAGDSLTGQSASEGEKESPGAESDYFDD